MSSLVCGAVLGIIAYACYTQSRKSREINEDSKARIWMIASVVTGAFAAVSIAAAIVG
jgi:hypothetical protein